MKKIVSLILALGLVCFGENQKEQKDSCVITCSKCVVSAIWGSNIDKYKQSFENEEAFYTIVDDIQWYKGEASRYIESKGIPIKYIEADHCPNLSYEGQNVNITPNGGIFSFVLFKSGKKPLVIDGGFVDYDVWVDGYFEIKDSQTSKYFSDWLKQ